MASPKDQEMLDEVAVLAHLQMFGKEAAAQLAADLYKLRRAEKAVAPSTFAGFPRWAIAALAVWLALLETADKLPRLLLAYPGYEATLAEFHSKMLQPDLVQTQLAKARLDAKAAEFAPDTASAQLERAKNEAKASAWQPYSTAAQAYDAHAKFINDASAITPDNLLTSGNFRLFGLRPN